jgi:hypothetical protein
VLEKIDMPPEIKEQLRLLQLRDQRVCILLKHLWRNSGQSLGAEWGEKRCSWRG